VKKNILISALTLMLMLLAGSSIAAENLVKNPSFEEESGGKPVGWSEWGYQNSPDVTEFKLGKGNAHSANTFATIINKKPNDARFVQTVSVMENTLYRISCWAKTEDVGQSQRGANISVEGRLEASKDVKGTSNGWENIELYASTGKGIKNIRLTLGLGGYGSVNTGKASFSDVVVEQVDSIPDKAARIAISGTDNSPKAANSPVNPRSGGPGKMLWIGLAAAVFIMVVAAFFFFKSSSRRRI
jgi:hypothetical protein